IEFALPGGEMIPPAIESLPTYLRRPMVVYEFLRKRNFDIVHGPDNRGLLYFCILAKRAGLDFAATHFIVGNHGSPYWISESNRLFATGDLLSSEMDRQSLELCDQSVSPSNYMVRYLQRKGWKLPKSALVIPNANHLCLRPGTPPTGSDAQKGGI